MNALLLIAGLIVSSRADSFPLNHPERKSPDKSPNLALWELSARDNMQVGVFTTDHLHTILTPHRSFMPDRPLHDHHTPIILFVTMKMAISSVGQKTLLE
jgi:hypothetical protein